MNRLRIRKIKDEKLIWIKFRHYIDVTILVCCLIIAFNIHPSSIAENNINNANYKTEKTKMTYIFHDYEGNEYNMNEKIHWSSSSWDYLFNDEIPNELKWEEETFSNSVSIWDLIKEQNQNESINTWESNNNEPNKSNSDLDIKDNQISVNDIMDDLWINSNNENQNNDKLVIDVWIYSGDDDNSRYNIKNDKEGNSLIIEKINDENTSWKKEDSNNKEAEYENNNSLIAKTFTFVEEWRILPTLISRNDLYFWNTNQAISYVKNLDTKQNTNLWNKSNNSMDSQKDETWITIIDDYADCMTPWWYKIHHWDSVLAYKQMEGTPDFCHIERRFCRKGKLSWTYTQQWCSINENYTYEQRWDVKVAQKNDDWFNWKNTRQNPDWSVSVKNSEIWWWEWIFNKPNKTSSSFSTNENNIREEDVWIEQTNRPYRDCTAPRWEKVKHWDFIQAFKHENWFSDAPCELQIRLCSMWELMWTYTESRCKTRNTSFIDRVNWSPSRKTYSKEKIELVKKQIKDEENYYENTRKNAQRSTDSDVLDRILYILDQD